MIVTRTGSYAAPVGTGDQPDPRDPRSLFDERFSGVKETVSFEVLLTLLTTS